MNNYIIIADSACDIDARILKDWGVKYASLTFKFEEDDHEYKNDDMSAQEFYDNMRNGRMAKTSAVNSETFKELFEEELKLGNDIIYLAFSSGLSTTYNSGRLAAEELRGKYPERKIMAVDTLCASAGYGLILYLAKGQRENGATIEELEKYVLDNRLKICHWYTVDDLKYLKKGGRISPAVAIVGGVLGIKPVMNMNDEGKLVNVSKARGRKQALLSLIDKYDEMALDKENGIIFVSHGDCMEDVLLVERELKDRYGNGIKLICDIGPVIGAHSGPGTFAMFYLGSNRNTQ